MIGAHGHSLDLRLRGFDRLTPFAGLPPGARPPEAAPGPLAPVSASAKPSPAPNALNPTDEVLEQWEAFKAGQHAYGERPLIRDFYDRVLNGRTKLTYKAVKDAIRAAQRRESRKPR